MSSVAAVAAPDTLTLSAFQARVLSVPEEFDLGLLGGRGGGKSFTLMLLALRHCATYKAAARVLYVRLTHRATLDWQSMALEWLSRVFGTALRYNSTESIFKLPGGGVIECNQVESEQDLSKFLGRSVTLLLIDEAGEYSSPARLDRLRGNLRAPAGIPVRTVIAANPGGPGNIWLSRRLAFHDPWEPFVEETSGRTFVLCPSTLENNEAIDRDGYRRQLIAATATDSELQRAWLTGSFAVNRGAFFADCLDEQRCAVETWPAVPTHRGEPWETFLCYDHGSAAPAICGFVARSPGAEAFGKYYARDSLIAFDELAIADPNDISQGLHWPVGKIAEVILELCARWDMEPFGGADPAIFANSGHSGGSIGHDFARLGVYFQPSSNNRLAGWSRMRQMFADCGATDRPGLYVARHCAQFWQTAPTIGRDPRRIEDLDSRLNDHCLDALRYGVMWEPQRVIQIDAWGANRRTLHA